MESRWAQDPRYSHGFLVPAFAAYILWSRRDERPPAAPSVWLGLGLFGAGALVRLAGMYSFFSWFDGVSLLVSTAGVVALLAGSSALRWAASSIAFLIFMVPLPYRVESSLGAPLQRFATLASASVLQIFGLPAFSSGNTITIDQFRIGVIDACNGLGMSYMFLACSVGAVLMIRRPFVDSALLIASAIPMGLATNIARIVATGLLHATMGRRIAETVYHDLAGWLVMLVALFVLWLECKLLPHLFIETGARSPDPAVREERARAPVGPRSAIARPPQIPAICAGVLIVIAAGITSGRWTNRWASTRELDEAAASLDRLPLEIGDWSGRVEAADPRETRAADVARLVVASYQNPRLARKVRLFVVCGRPGPVAVHTPDVCYPSAGYTMVQASPQRLAVECEPRSAPAEFLGATFRQEDSITPDAIRIYWSWSSGGKWSVPDHPRLAFAGRPFLYKLYVIFDDVGQGKGAAGTSETEFIGRLLRALETTLPRDSDLPPA
jgi:exosortase